MRTTMLCSVTLLLLVLAPPLSAQMSGGGTVTYVPATMEMSPLPDGTMLQYAHMKGVVIATDPSVPLHLSTSRDPAPACRRR